MSESNESESETRTSVFKRLEGGNRRKNIVWLAIYAIVWPLGVAAMLRGFRRAYTDEKDRVMGTGEKLLTVWLSFALVSVVLAMAVVSIGAYDAISSGEFSDWSSSTDSTESEQTFSEWQEENSDRIEAAETSWEDGEEKVVEAEEMEPSLVDGPIDLLEDAHGSYDEAQTSFGTLEDEALSNAEKYPEGSRQQELFTTAAEYYGNMESAALFRKTAISIILDNPDGDISQSEEDTFYARLEQSESHYEDAQATKSELDELLEENRNSE